MDRAGFLKRLYMKLIGARLQLRSLKLPDEVFLRSEKDVRIAVKSLATARAVDSCIRHHGLEDGQYVVFEPEETEVFLGRIKHASVFYDLGAHVGYYTLLAASHGNVHRVVAFEMLEEMCREIRLHAGLNGFENILIESTPVGDGKTVVEFGHHLGYKKELSTSLDRFVRETNIEPDLIKMDIEGFEFLALRGAERTIVRSRPELMLSLHPGAIAKNGGDAGWVVSFLKDNYPHVYRVKACPRKGLAAGDYLSDIKGEDVFTDNCTLYCSHQSIN